MFLSKRLTIRSVSGNVKLNDKDVRYFSDRSEFIKFFSKKNVNNLFLEKLNKLEFDGYIAKVKSDRLYKYYQKMIRNRRYDFVFSYSFNYLYRFFDMNKYSCANGESFLQFKLYNGINFYQLKKDFDIVKTLNDLLNVYNIEYYFSITFRDGSRLRIDYSPCGDIYDLKFDNEGSSNAKSIATKFSEYSSLVNAIDLFICEVLRIECDRLIEKNNKRQIICCYCGNPAGIYKIYGENVCKNCVKNAIMTFGSRNNNE